MLAPRSAKAWHTSIPGKLHGIRNLPGSPSFSRRFLRASPSNLFNGKASCETNVEALNLMIGKSSHLFRSFVTGLLIHSRREGMEYLVPGIDIGDNEERISRKSEGIVSYTTSSRIALSTLGFGNGITRRVPEVEA
ncbi:hypothetical protein Tco_0431898 [Tanacetum coccineum]